MVVCYFGIIKQKSGILRGGGSRAQIGILLLCLLLELRDVTAHHMDAKQMKRM